MTFTKVKRGTIMEVCGKTKDLKKEEREMEAEFIYGMKYGGYGE